MMMRFLAWLASFFPEHMQAALDAEMAKQMGEAVSMDAEEYRAKLLKELRRWPNVMST